MSWAKGNCYKLIPECAGCRPGSRLMNARWSDGTRVEIGSDLAEALEALVGRRTSTGAAVRMGSSDQVDQAADRQAGPSAGAALDLYRKAQERLREGDLAGYDRLQRQLEQVLRSMADEEE